MLAITSTQNPVIKLIRSLSEKKFRQDTGLFVAEGHDMLARARACGWTPSHYLSTEPVAPWGEVRPLVVTDKVMATLSSQKNPHPVLATFAQRYAPEVHHQGLWLVLEDMRDPGNLGSILRSADAVGAAGVVLVGATCDPFGRESVRASTGSIFAMPLLRMTVDAFLALARSWSGDVVGTHLEGGQDYRQSYASPTLLLMGSEGSGLSPALVKACTRVVRIPMRSGVESLNVAAATTLMLYQVQGVALA
jgi:TrmH family RNA methyltransferase